MTDASRFAILGTAGHIDHGKTALVRLLTGVDTDRLKEEQERGISIDLGFAHLQLPSGMSCGLVDVPGHERFVKNMLAGAGGVDAVLVAVAADEGIMPQTREHLDIVRLLGVRHGVVGLTKIDMVETEWLELVTEAVREYLDTLGYGHFPIVPVSSKTGAGKAELLQAIDRVLSQAETKADAGAARLPVDRSFSVTGFGTVVTGTLWEGTVKVGDKLMVEPGGHAVRVRNVQVHGRDAPRARAGQRTAVALHGVERENVMRGTWLVEPGVYQTGSILDVRVRVLEDAPKPLRRRQRIRFHLGASETLARVVPLEAEALLPGQEGLAQIRLEKPALAHPGDRFVVRSYSPSHTIAGGTVIVAASKKRRLRDAASLDELRREESGTPQEKLAALVRRHPGGLLRADLLDRAGLGPAGEQELDAMSRVLAPEPGWVIHVEDWDRLQEQAREACAAYHRKHPLKWGIPKGDLKSALPDALSPIVFQRLLDTLTQAGDLARREDLFRREAAAPELPADTLDRLDRLRRALAEGGATPPSVKDLAALIGTNPEPFLDHLVFEDGVVRVSPELAFTREAFETIASWLKIYFQEHKTMTVGDLREGLGMSRKFSVPVLEYFDRLGWTRRSGDSRIAGRRLGEGL